MLVAFVQKTRKSVKKKTPIIKFFPGREGFLASLDPFRNHLTDSQNHNITEFYHVHI